MTKAENYLASRFSDVEAEMEKTWVGVKMVCIDDSFSDEQISIRNALPLRGHVYTIRAIQIRSACREKDGPGVALLFDEIVNTRLLFGREPGFYYARFEPCDSDEE